MSRAIRQYTFRKWYLSARRVYPKLPPWRLVRVDFSYLIEEMARCQFDLQGGRVTRVHIRINRLLRRGRIDTKTVFRSYAHELVHVIHPWIDHGVRFEHAVVRMKAAMEKDPSWY